MIWMGVVAVLAAISTVNVVIGSCARICEGMAQLGLIPAVFKKRNFRNMPYAGIILMTLGLCAVLIITQAEDSEGLLLLILTGCSFWMIAYIIAHVNMLVMRRRMPDAPRSFKLPLGPVLPIVGILGMLWMILNIYPDPDFQAIIWRTVGIALVLLAIYGVLWIKLKMKGPLFRPMSVDEIMKIQEAADAEQEAHWQARIAAAGGSSKGDGSDTDKSS